MDCGLWCPVVRVQWIEFEFVHFARSLHHFATVSWRSRIRIWTLPKRFHWPTTKQVIPSLKGERQVGSARQSKTTTRSPSHYTWSMCLILITFSNLEIKQLAKCKTVTKEDQRRNNWFPKHLFRFPNHPVWVSASSFVSESFRIPKEDQRRPKTGLILLASSRIISHHLASSRIISRHSFIFVSESSGQISSIDDDIGAPVHVAAGAEHRICLRRAGRATARGHDMIAKWFLFLFFLMFYRFVWLLWKATRSIYTSTHEQVLCQPGSVDMCLDSWSHFSWAGSVVLLILMRLIS